MADDISNQQLLGGLTQQLDVIADNMATKDDLNKVKQELGTDLHKQGILLEKLEGEFKTVSEMISDSLKVKGRVDSHENRISSLETDNNLIKPTVKVHSAQLKRLAGQ